MYTGKRRRPSFSLAEQQALIDNCFEDKQTLRAAVPRRDKDSITKERTKLEARYRRHIGKSVTRDRLEDFKAFVTDYKMKQKQAKTDERRSTSASPATKDISKTSSSAKKRPKRRASTPGRRIPARAAKTEAESKSSQQIREPSKQVSSDWGTARTDIKIKTPYERRKQRLERRKQVEEKKTMSEKAPVRRASSSQSRSRKDRTTTSSNTNKDRKARRTERARIMLAAKRKEDLKKAKKQTTDDDDETDHSTDGAQKEGTSDNESSESSDKEMDASHTDRKGTKESKASSASKLVNQANGQPSRNEKRTNSSRNEKRKRKEDGNAHTDGEEDVCSLIKLSGNSFVLHVRGVIDSLAEHYGVTLKQRGPPIPLKQIVEHTTLLREQSVNLSHAQRARTIMAILEKGFNVEPRAHILEGREKWLNFCQHASPILETLVPCASPIFPGRTMNELLQIPSPSSKRRMVQEEAFDFSSSDGDEDDIEEVPDESSPHRAPAISTNVMTSSSAYSNNHAVNNSAGNGIMKSNTVGSTVPTSTGNISYINGMNESSGSSAGSSDSAEPLPSEHGIANGTM